MSSLLFGLLGPFLMFGGLALYHSKLQQQFRPATPSAGELAARLGMTLVEGDASADLGATPNPFVSANRSIRMVGTRLGRSVELVQRVSSVVVSQGFLSGERESEHSSDCRLTLSVAASGTFEIVHRFGGQLASRRVMQPTTTLGLSAIDEKLEIRTGDARVFHDLVPELMALAAMPVVHVTLIDGRLSLHEQYGTSALAMHAEKILPVFERIAARLEDAGADEEAPTRAMPAAAFDPLAVDDAEEAGTLGRSVRVLSTSIAMRVSGAAVTLILGFGTLSLLVDAITRRSSAPLALAGIVGLLAVGVLGWTMSAVRRRVILRQRGFEWRGLVGSGSARYADVRNPHLEVRREGSVTTVSLFFEVDRARHCLRDLDGLDELHNAMRAAR